MQTITHEIKNIHSLFDEIENAYVLTSERRDKLVSPVYDESFEELFELFKEYGNVEYSPALCKKHFIPLDTAFSDEKTIIICVSGGKDSLATILHYLKQDYKIYLYHLKGINFTYKDEYKVVEELAERLKLPLIEEDVKLTGKQEWIEHPMKNMIIASMALQWGIRNKVTTQIAFGNFNTSSLKLDPFDVCAGDCKEMWSAYEKIIHRVLRDFSIQSPLTNFQDTIDAILQKPEYLEHTQSCIGPYRYREYLKTNNEKKYNIKLLPHRCGSCWKCCLEYCVFCDNDIFEYNEEYYKHCMRILRSTLYKETGIKYNLDETWKHYFFYDRSKSKWVV